MSEPGADGDGEKSVPDEKADNGVFGDMAFLPGDFGMGEIGDYGGGNGRNESGEPEEVVVSDDEVGED